MSQLCLPERVVGEDAPEREMAELSEWLKRPRQQAFGVAGDGDGGSDHLWWTLSGRDTDKQGLTHLEQEQARGTRPERQGLGAREPWG